MARDLVHDAVRAALEKENWVITDDPLSLSYEDIDASIDLGAEKVIAAQKGKQKIAVEVKSFHTPSIFYSFHQALGQFLNYRRLMQLLNEDRVLYLAVPSDAYTKFFIKPFAQLVIKEEQLNLLVFDPITEKITEWISQKK